MPGPYAITLAQATDPFTAGYKLLIAALKGNTAFKDAAARFTDWSDGATTKPLTALAAADCPEITLIQGAFVLMPDGRNSRIATLIQTYTLVAVTDTLQIATANEVKWAMAGAIENGQLEQATWNGNPFVADYTISNSQDGTTGVNLPGLSGSPARGVDRIVSIAAIQLTMYAPRSSLPT